MITIMRPGKVEIHHALPRLVIPSEIIPPNDAVGFGTPAPRKERPASIRMM
jgi:hypothetical protein